MTQVITFFGWLIVSICVTVVIFGHISIAFVYGIDRLFEDMFPSEGLSSLLFFVAAPLPGSVLLGIGKWMKFLDNRTAAREAAAQEKISAREAAAEAEAANEQKS